MLDLYHALAQNRKRSLFFLAIARWHHHPITLSGNEVCQGLPGSQRPLLAGPGRTMQKQNFRLALVPLLQAISHCLPRRVTQASCQYLLLSTDSMQRRIYSVSMPIEPRCQ